MWGSCSPFRLFPRPVLLSRWFWPRLTSGRAGRKVSVSASRARGRVTRAETVPPGRTLNPALSPQGTRVTATSKVAVKVNWVSTRVPPGARPMARTDRAARCSSSQLRPVPARTGLATALSKERDIAAHPLARRAGAVIG